MKRLAIVLAVLLFVPALSAVKTPQDSEPIGSGVCSEAFDLEVGSGPLGLEMSVDLKIILDPPALSCSLIQCTSHSTCQNYDCGLCDYEVGLPWGYCGLM